MTETQTIPGESVNDINDHLSMFTVLHNSSVDKFSSMAFAYSNDITVMSCDMHHGFMIVKLMKPSFKQNLSLTIAILYRKNNTPLRDFWDRLSYLIQAVNIDILVGDFNANFYDDNVRAKLIEILPNYDPVFYDQGGTHIDGALLDYVYLKVETDIYPQHSTIKCVYFSDHDAVKVSFQGLLGH